MVEVLLIQPPIRDFYLTTKRTIPYGLACIAAALIKEGFSVQILDCLASRKSRTIPLPYEMSFLRSYYGRQDISPFGLFHQFKHFGWDFRQLELAVGVSGATLVGISSLFTAYSDEAIEAAERVKSSLHQCKIVLGGHHPTALPREVMRCSAIDYVIRGEGEVAMPDLAKALRRGSSVESISGLVFRHTDGTLRIGNPALLDKLDTSPLPAFHLVNHDYYRRGPRRSMVVCTSRGCPRNCSYCSLGVSSHTRYRRRSVESVLREIESAVVEHDVGFIDFEDENISLEKQWFMELLCGVRERFAQRQIELRAMNGLFPPSLDEGIVQQMAAAGFRALNLALGSTSKEQLKRFKRPDVVDSFDRVLSYAEQYGLEAVGYIIIGAPGQNALDSMKDLLHLAGRRVLAGVSVFYPSPGSQDYLNCEVTGILPSTFKLMRATAFPICDTTIREESVTLLRLGRLLNFIKSLLDKGFEVPEPLPISTGRIPLGDKMERGRILVQGFLHDGIIRGISPDGNLFEHETSKSISVGFRNALLKTLIKGMRN